MKNQAGQAVIEFILLTIAITAIGAAVAAGFKNYNIIGEMVNRPWALLSGMIENGVWDTPKKGKEKHPNFLRRGVSFKGDRE